MYRTKSEHLGRGFPLPGWLPLLLAAVTAVTPASASKQVEPVPSTQAQRSQAPANSEAGTPNDPSVPHVHHAPLSTASAGQPLAVEIELDSPDLVRRVLLLLKLSGDPRIREVPFRLSTNGRRVAMIPASALAQPWVEYMIEVEPVTGQRYPAFGLRTAMHRVQVVPAPEQLRVRKLLQGLDGRRSTVDTSAEFVRFGTTNADVLDPATGDVVTKGIHDEYVRVEASYTYRPLSTVAAFSLRLGIVRGRSVVPGVDDESKLDVGLNYGAPTLLLRLTDYAHLELELLTSLTEIGFSSGGGGALLLGDPYRTHVTFGTESIKTFGTRFYSRVDLPVGERTMIAPIVEATDMPHADRYGVRLMVEGSHNLGHGFRIAARGGYQARSFSSGGPGVGGTLGYSF